MWRLVGGAFIGWGLGSNDSANIFGTGVAANVLKYRAARTVSTRTLIQIVIGWVLTPLFCGAIAYWMMRLYLVQGA
jgi:phosphate/sulfate permease